MAGRYWQNSLGVVTKPTPALKNEPRLLSALQPVGSSRRPPYELKYVKRENWDQGTCWAGQVWTESDVAAYQEPSEREPLALLINTDFIELERFRKSLLAKKLSENEIKNRIVKYSSHVGYHLYQMYSASKEREKKSEGLPAMTTSAQRQEVHRVAMTLLKLMEVSR